MSLPPPLPILWQDDDVVAVDKPENLAAIPESAGDPGCLQMRLAAQLGTRLWVVHRLDKEVSGAILFAKNAAAHRCLNDQFAERETGKGYLALVHGVMDRDEGAVDKRVHQFGSGRMGVDPRGKPSLTHYRVVRRHSAHTLAQASPVTGRRHQIRVHFYSLGHPIVGDLRFGDVVKQRAFPRLMLHAASIEFRRPAGPAHRIDCPAPESFRALYRTLTGEADLPAAFP